MSEARRAVFGRAFARDLWRLVRIYWTSRAARWGALLLAGAVGLELATVFGTVLLSDGQRRIFDALGDRAPGDFAKGLTFFFGAALLTLFASTFRIYLRQRLEIHWREFLTADYVQRWVGPQAYWQAELHEGNIDNPDQRISEDIRDFVASALGLSLSLLSAVVTLASFGGILWQLSGRWPVHISGTEYHIPGLMMWVALLYAVLAMWLTNLVGRKLVPINFDRLRCEADFRYGLVRFRDHAEAVLLARGERVEQESLGTNFRHVVANYLRLIGGQRDLMLLTSGIGHANTIIPLLIAAPAFFAGHLTLGMVAQVRVAYAEVSGALTWFVNAYQEIARWRANIQRLTSFSEAMATTAEEIDPRRAGLRITPAMDSVLRLTDVRLDAPGGRILLSGASGTINAGERVAILGSAGAGKTTLFRAIAGMWPFGAGQIEVPSAARMLFIPQRAYLPIGTLRAAVAYPSPPADFPLERIGEVLALLDLEHLVPLLDERAHWEQRLSGAEQQRLAIARVFVQRPDWLFLDEVTSALDGASEKHVYELLAERLPNATVVAVAQRPITLRHFPRRWFLSPVDHGPATLQAQ
ncbi:MAG TPA: ABC transporter ATP-binding protein/permease [Candidatus Dormibacteraeota bacterium]|nr:ABC transporter ATP-binding protein/permease [Candidatus Dormibacteraeota bacterium]